MHRRSILGWAPLGVIALLSATACGSHSRRESDDAQGRPRWIDDPGDGVSASAGFHVRGRQAQEDLAISRARDEFARRYGVRVSNESTTEQAVAGGRMVSTMQASSSQSVTGAEVKAMVRAKWLDTGNGVLWVWLVPAP
jgi:hypothetical protein